MGMAEQDRTRRQFVKGVGLAGAALLTGIHLNKAEAAPVPKEWDVQADVVIAGFGGAGACAAIEAGKTGSSVLLLEKTDVPGGSTTLSGGIVLAAGTNVQKSLGIQDTPEEMFKYLRVIGQGKAVDALIRVVADMSAENIAWLESLGVEFPKEKLWMSGMEDEPEYASITPPKKRGHRPEGAGGAVFKALYNAVKAQKNVRIMTGTEALRLIATSAATETNSEVIGVRAKGAGKEINILARKAVILTTGGVMSGDLTKPWLIDYSPDLAPTVPAGSLASTADGYRMGMSCGAAMKGLNTGSFLPSVFFPWQKMAGIVMMNIWNLPNIYVKENGARFTNEGAYYAMVGENMLQQKVTTAFCVFDSDTVKTALELAGKKWLPATMTLAHGIDPKDMEKGVRGGFIWKGETAAELAKNAGIDAVGLEKSISVYNKNAEAGKDPEFNRNKGLAPIKTQPFYAFKIHVGMVCHNGGLSINPKAQVLDTFGTVVPRLYAAGRDSIGMFGGHYPGSGGAIADLLAFGRIAGRSAAAEVPQK